MYKIVCILILGLIVAACGGEKKESKKALTDEKPVVSDSTFVLGLYGTIEKLGVSMKLTKSGDKLEGSYYYNEKLLPLKLKGVINEAGEVEMDEMNAKNKRTGTFVGKLVDNKFFSGFWHSPSGKRFPFKLEAWEELPVFVTVRNSSYTREFEGLEEYMAENEIDPEFVSSEGFHMEVKTIRISTTDAQVNKKINAAIEKELLGLNETQYRSIEQMLDDYSEPMDREIEARVLDCNKNILSVIIGDYSYFIGAAHPSFVSSCLNFDLTTGKLIRMDDLIAMKNKARIANFLEPYFLRENPEGPWWYQESNESFPIPSDFYFTRTSVYFSFQQYEVGPYAAGSPGFEVNYNDLKKIKRQGGYLDRFVK